MNTPTHVLETYLRAKDDNRPSLILDCYAPDAVLTYSIATDTISFPARVVGADPIAQTLVRDFRKNFDRCRTYYVCDPAAWAGGGIDFLPWLVIMRQMSNSALRLGRGYYRWEFDTDAARIRVAAMHIHIDRMDVIEDIDGARLQILQSALPYPWLLPEALREAFVRTMQQTPGFAFLDDFKSPMERPAR